MGLQSKLKHCTTDTHFSMHVCSAYYIFIEADTFHCPELHITLCFDPAIGSYKGTDGCCCTSAPA